jgi:hypothetical protein
MAYSAERDQPGHSATLGGRVCPPAFAACAPAAVIATRLVVRLSRAGPAAVIAQRAPAVVAGAAPAGRGGTSAASVATQETAGSSAPEACIIAILGTLPETSTGIWFREWRIMQTCRCVATGPDPRPGSAPGLADSPSLRARGGRLSLGAEDRAR